MDLNRWPVDRFERVTQRIAVVGQGAGIDDDAGGSWAFLLQKVHNGAFVIGLEAANIDL